MAEAFAPPVFDAARWEPLRYLNSFRLVLAGLFIVAGRELELGGDDPALFLGAAWAWFATALALGFEDAARRLGLGRLVTVQVLLDIGLLTLLMAASGGYRSGIPTLILVMLAGTGLVASGRMVLFHAAVATLAVLLENSLRFLSGRATMDFFTVGVTCIGFFAVAQLARLLAQRALANEALARRRGEALANQVKLNQQIIEDMQDGVLVIGARGRIRHFNPQACALLGVELAEKANLADVAPALARLVELGGSARDDADGGTLRAEGSGRLLLVRMLPAAGEPHAGAERDRLVYLEDFDRTQRRIQQVKLAALGRLTASIAHEIRNPLSAVSQAAELLHDEKRGDMQARLIRIIEANARRIEGLVSDVLALGRRDEAQPERLPLAAFVEGFLVDHLLDGDAADGTIQRDIPPELAIEIDRTHLHQILGNLVGNARRHGSGGPGSVRIRAARCDDGRVALEIADDGAGVPEALRAQIFEPFFTTHTKGTGLGLYIARELADANGAILELLPDGPGARFRLTAKSRP